MLKNDSVVIILFSSTQFEQTLQVTCVAINKHLSLRSIENNKIFPNDDELYIYNYIQPLHLRYFSLGVFSKININEIRTDFTILIISYILFVNIRV